MPDLLERLKSALADRYAVESEIGRGGMAVVYLAEDLKHKRKVAIKVLHPELTATLGAERFLKEVEIAARLDHPHIVPLYDSGTADGLLYFVMPYVAGESVRDRLERVGQLPIDEAIRIATDVADGLAYAHAQGVVHRDIKPGNVLLSAGHARIADFGVARAIDLAAGGSATQSGTAVGTPVYMAPEQATGQVRGDERSDIYSVGCLLYELLVGEPPYSGLTPQTILARKMTESAPRIRPVRDTVSPEVDDVVSCSIARIPADRFQSALDLKIALENAGRGDPATSETSPAASTGEGRPSRRFATAAIVLLVLVAAGYLGVSFFGTGQSGGADELQIRSLAVHPRATRSEGEEDQAFSDGMTDALTSTLSRMDSVWVLPATSSLLFDGSGKTIPDIARELDVDAIVELAVHTVDEQIRISLRLVHGRTFRVLWSRDYVEMARDVFAMQARVSQNAADSIQSVLAPEQPARSGQPAYSENPKANEAYRVGRHHLIRWSSRDATKAAASFEQAIALDSTFALAHAGLAEVCALTPIWGPTAYNPGECEARAHRALALDPTLAPAHMALGLVWAFQWDWAQAGASFRRAVELDPNSAMAHLWYAWFLSQFMRFDESLAVFRRAEALDPLNPFVKTMVSQGLMNDHRYDEGLAKTAEVLSLDPDYGVAHVYEAGFYNLMGMPDRSLAASQRALNRMGEGFLLLQMLTGWSHALKGEERKALDALRRLEDTEGGLKPLYATVYVALGRYEEALAVLERGYEVHATFLPNSTAQPNFDPIRDHPRFRALRRNLGFER